MSEFKPHIPQHLADESQRLRTNALKIIADMDKLLQKPLTAEIRMQAADIRWQAREELFKLGITVAKHSS